MTALLSIPARFNGPPASGNGGYVCGAIAAAIGVPVEVTLRHPPPLDTPMEVTSVVDGWRVSVNGTLIAEATGAGEPPSVPTAPSLEQARAAATRYLGLVHHEFPTCFTCGPGRDDGLGIFSGPVDGSEVVAAPWTPQPSRPDEDGAVARPIVWAALDCPGAWATMRTDTDAPVVLGRMTAWIDHIPEVGEEYVSYGWLLHKEGRKATAGTALADATGQVIARAAQTWIEVARSEGRGARGEG